MIVKAMREGLGRLIVFIDFITRPKPMQRSSEEQQAVEEAARGLALYQFFACPFCIKTRRAIHALNLPIETRDAQHDQEYRQELESGGGKIQVPCLRIEEGDEVGGRNEVRWMYESGQIIDYLQGRFGEPRAEADA